MQTGVRMCEEGQHFFGELKVRKVWRSQRMSVECEGGAK